MINLSQVEISLAEEKKSEVSFGIHAKDVNVEENTKVGTISRDNTEKNRSINYNAICFYLAAFGQLTSLEYCWEKHDNCDSLNYNEFKYGLQNKEEQRYWHCNCDLEFYYCLHRLNSTLSNHIGELYFNYNTLCYRQDHEVDKCREYDRLNGPNSEEKRCVQYVLNLNTEQRNQWFDLPFYSGKPMKGPLYKIKTR